MMNGQRKGCKTSAACSACALLVAALFCAAGCGRSGAGAPDERGGRAARATESGDEGTGRRQGGIEAPGLKADSGK